MSFFQDLGTVIDSDDDNVKIEKQIVKTRKVKNLSLFTHKKIFVHDKFCLVT